MLLFRCSVSLTLCWTAAQQASLSFPISRNLLKLMSLELVMPSNHLILCCPLLLLSSIFPSIRAFSSESAHCIRWPKYWTSGSAPVYPIFRVDIHPLGLTGLISLLSKGLSRVFLSPTVQNINSSVLSLLHGSTLKSIHDY